MKKVFAVTAALALLILSVAAQANVFDLGSVYTNLETVGVSNVGNADDMRLQSDGTSGYGSVGYSYNIGKYEVTARQYTDFLNSKAKCDADPYGLYNTAMWSDPYGCKIQRTGGGTVANPYVYTVADDWANRPVNFVSFWDACRFANWLGNGQGSGSTENGAYTLGGYNGPDGGTIQRNASWNWAVTSEDEWYKAAYYDPNKPGGAGYWDYPTKNNTKPSNVGSDGYVDPGNHANYWDNGYTLGDPYWRTYVGEFEHSTSAYGTFDQGGNVYEWNEAVYYQGEAYSYRNARGGSFTSVDYMQAWARNVAYSPMEEDGIIGFRVVQSVPEPSSIFALLTGAAGLLCLRRRKP